MSPDEYVESRAPKLVEEWRAACRIPSVSERDPNALETMAAWVADRSSRIFDTVELVETTAAGPTVVATVEGIGDRCLLMYSHYDVQPVEPVAAWTFAPFEATLNDGRVISRGAADDKADVVGRLHALEAWQATRGRLPFSVIWLCEGAEESGSVGLPELIDSRRALLERADWCLWESYLRGGDGRPEIGFGCRGMLYVELTLNCLEHDQHSAFASILRSAPAELNRALETLRDRHGIVTVDGFHEHVRDLGEVAADLGVELPRDVLGVAGRSPFIEADSSELARRLLFEPTANIAGLVSGNIGDGAKTILPAEARAKLDFRLVPDQDPADIAAKLREHLDARGFDEVTINVLHSVPPAASSMNSALARATVAAAEEMFGRSIRYPFVPGSGPVHHIAHKLGIPTVMPPGATRMDSGIHGPNESVSVDDYLDLVRFTARLIERLGERAG